MTMYGGIMRPVEIVDREQVRMLQAGDEAGLPLKAFSNRLLVYDRFED
jgi:hypothetical protein